MARPRDYNIYDLWCCDEDSDIDDEDNEDEMQETFSEMREIVQAQDECIKKEVIKEEVSVQASVPSQGLGYARIHTGSSSIADENNEVEMEDNFSKIREIMQPQLKQEVVEKEIWVIRDYEDEMQETFYIKQEVFEEEVSVPRASESEPSRGPGYDQNQRGSCSSERSPTPTSLPRRSPREMDEANGWTYVQRKVPPDNPVFESQVGVKAPVDQTSSQYDCLQLFFNDDFWGLVETETNRYASQMKAELARCGQLKRGSMLHNWTPVTLSELKLFFSVVIHMTLVHKKTFDFYWSTKSLLHCPFPSQAMKRDRFRAIYSCLHLNDNSNYIPQNQENYDAFFKIRLYFDQLCRLCEDFYLPSENLTIDVGTFNKREKNGMKLNMICDSDTGYVLRMIPCIGDSKTAEQIVRSLAEPYLGKWHTIYMDQFLTSPTVFDVLWLNNTRAVGTVMLNQSGLPQQWRQQPLVENEMAFCHRDNMTACKWKDKRVVCFLSTKHAASWSEVDVKVKGEKVKRLKPDCMLDYNINKTSVDLNNQCVSDYSLRKKSMKLWKKIFFHLVTRSMVNAYIIYYKVNEPQRRKGFDEFLNQCGEAMAQDGGYRAEARSAGPHTSSVSRLIGRHFMEKIPSTEKKQAPSRVCKVCADASKKKTGKRGRKESRFYCPDCNVPLCNTPCFKIYHTRKDYAS